MQDDQNQAQGDQSQAQGDQSQSQVTSQDLTQSAKEAMAKVSDTTQKAGEFISQKAAEYYHASRQRIDSLSKQAGELRENVADGAGQQWQAANDEMKQRLAEAEQAMENFQSASEEQADTARQKLSDALDALSSAVESASEQVKPGSSSDGSSS